MTVSQASPNATGNITCPQFNAALGHLTQVVVFSPDTLTFAAGSSFSIRNPTASDIGSATPESIFGVKLKITLGAYPDGQNAVLDTPMAAFFTTIDAGTTTTFYPPAQDSLSGDSFTIINPNGYAALLGTGAFLVPVSVVASDITASQGELPLTLAGYSATFYLDPPAVPFPQPNPPGPLAIWYWYTPNTVVPEPSTNSLAACAFGLFLATRFRRSVARDSTHV